MADRYSTITREVPVERERNTVFVPGDPAGSLDMHEPECAIRIPGGECSCPAGWELGKVDEPTEAHWAELQRRIRVQLNRTPEEWAALKQVREQASPADAGPRVLSSQHRVSLHSAGFRVRERGALEGTVVHAYRCPVHGLVDVRVPRSDVPDEVPCSHRDIEPVSAGGITQGRPVFCGRTATWAGSQCGQGWAAGECKS